MHTLLNSEIDLLVLAATAEPDPCLPAPDCISTPVAHLLELGLLQEREGRVTISEDGRIALEANRDRMFDWEA